jgi:hypothetical protein
MIRQILPNNNKRCYSNFSPTFREVNTPLVEILNALRVQIGAGRANQRRASEVALAKHEDCRAYRYMIDHEHWRPPHHTCLLLSSLNTPQCKCTVLRSIYHQASAVACRTASYDREGGYYYSGQVPSGYLWIWPEATQETAVSIVCYRLLPLTFYGVLLYDEGHVDRDPFQRAHQHKHYSTIPLVDDAWKGNFNYGNGSSSNPEDWYQICTTADKQFTPSILLQVSHLTFKLLV